VVASLLVSVVLLGFKLSAAESLVQVNQRRTELKASLVLLEPKIEAEKLAVWLADVEHDEKQREDRIAAMHSDAGSVYNVLEADLLAKGADMFAVFEASSAGTKQLTHSATVMYSETKLDAATGLLFGRAAAMVRATPQEIIAYSLNYDGRFLQSTLNPTVYIRRQVVEHVNAHQTIIFNRCTVTGISDRTFLNSIVAKRVEADPPTYLLVGLPIAQHDKIAPKDEKRAVRAENCKAFKLTEVAAGITKLEYTCSLNLRGSIPQAFTNKVSVPATMNGAPLPHRLPHTSTPARPVCFARTRHLLSRKRCASRYWCGWMQCQRRCSGTSNKFCRSQSATPGMAESSGSCSLISWAETRRIWLVPYASSRTAPQCFATAVSHTSVTCSRGCSAPMCKVGRTTMRRPFPLHRSRPQP
jgi:hypothetical protein